MKTAVAAREPKPNPREAASVAQILRYLNGLPQCRAEKRHGSVYGVRGAPDITGCLRGRRLELEVNRRGERATPLQQTRLAQWAAAGAITGVVVTVADVTALLEAAS